MTLAQVVIYLFVILFLAFLVESLVEYFIGIPLKSSRTLSFLCDYLKYIAAVVGILLCLYYELDIVYLVVVFTGGTIKFGWVGMLLTGLVIGRGSNFVHDLYTRFLSKKIPSNVVST